MEIPGLCFMNIRVRGNKYKIPLDNDAATGAVLFEKWNSFMLNAFAGL